MKKGNPEYFNGNGIVAFIDILGFSNYINENWNIEGDKTVVLWAF